MVLFSLWDGFYDFSMSGFRFQRAVLRADSLLLSAALLVSLFSLVTASLVAAGKRPDRLFGCFLACFAVDCS